VSKPALVFELDRLIDSTDGVWRLRRFILDLAARGKLVDQDPADPPALESVRASNSLTARRNAARSATEDPILPAALAPPPSWGWVRLTEIADVLYGFAFDSAQFNSDRSGLPLIRIRDISSVDTQAYFDGPFDPRFIVRRGDYLIGMDGNFNVRRWRGDDGLLNQRVMRIRDWAEGVVPEFMAIPLQMAVEGLHAGTSQTTVKHLSAKQVNTIVLPLPPLAEQHRIVTKVDELMSLSDQLEAAQVSREERRSALRMACLTRLTSLADDSPAVEHREETPFFLNESHRMLTRPEHVTNIRGAILDLALGGRFTANSAIPAPVELRQLAKLQNGYAFKSEWFVSSGTRLLRNANVGHGRIRWDDAVYLSRARTEEFERFELVEGDIVLSLDRPFITTGVKVAQVTASDLPCLLLQRVGRFVFDRACLDPRYLYLWVCSPHFVKQIDPGRSNGVPHVSSKEVESAAICVPPLPEQHRIVAKVEELMAVCDELERTLTTTQTHRARLLEAVLHEALADAGVDAERALH
jgi:type I restriction enzyme, S subunit